MNSLSQANFIELMSGKIHVARKDMDELKVYGVLIEDLDDLDKRLKRMQATDRIQKPINNIHV